MEKNFIEKHLSTNWPEKIGQRLVALMALTLLFAFCAQAQDASVFPANDNTKVPWVNDGTHFTTVTASGTGWTNPDRIYNTNTADYATHTLTGSGVKTTSAASVSNGQTFITKPFTGYWVGAVVARSLQLGTVINPVLTNKINLLVYNDNILVDSKEFDWNLVGDSDVGFYIHKQFDEVRIQLTSSITGIGASIDHRIKHVYFQRYTRFGGGPDNVGDKEATCNAPVPLTGMALTAEGQAWTFVGPVLVYVPATLWPGLISSVTDMDPATHGNIPYVTAGGAVYKGSIGDEAVEYPAGTLGGIVYRLTGAFATGVLVKTLSFYKGTDPTPVYTKTKTEILNATLNSDYYTASEVCPVAFDRIGYEINMYFSGGLGNIEVFYPVVQRFCDAPVACTADPISLISGVQGGAQNYPVYATALGTSVVNASVGSPGITNVDRVTDSDLNNYATMGPAVIGGTAYAEYGISVISQEGAKPLLPTPVLPTGYPVGTYAGFEIEEDDWGSASFSKKYVISTYLNGAFKESYSNQDLAGAGFLTPNQGRHLLGFKTSLPFNEVRITVQNILSASAVSPTKVYRAVIQEFCPTVINSLTNCNEVKQLKTSNGFPMYIDIKNTGVSGLGTGNTYFANLENIISGSTSPATFSSVVGGITTASVGVQDGSRSATDLYPKGTFAGFDVAFPTLASGQLAGTSITITLLGPDGTNLHSEVMSSSFFGAHSSLLSGSTSRQIIGYAAPVAFSGVKITIQKNASVDLGVLAIYSAVIERFCAGVVDCAAIDELRNPEHPLYINGKNTGVNAFADGNSSIANSQNAIDANATNYARIQLGATVGAEVGFSVANGVNNADGTKYHYPAETYVGFDVETQNWFEANGLYQTKIELYRDGVLVQSGTGSQLGAGVTSSVVSGWQREILGTVAHTTFDEVRLVSSRVAGASIGEMRIYGFVAQNFDPATATACVVPLECNKTIQLNDGTNGSIPAVIEFDRTGYTGLASAGYGIQNAWNVVSASTADFAVINLPGAVAATGSISVATPGKVYPAGTFAGFVVQKKPFIFAGGVFVGVTVRTYLHGALQEEKTDAALADFSLVTQWFGTSTNFYNPGFKTTKTFDEVQVSIGALASAGDQTLNVYGAYVDTRESTPTTGDGSTAIVCTPDLTPTFRITPANVIGSGGTTLACRVLIKEVNKVATNSAVPIYVLVPVSGHYTLNTYNSAQTSSGGLPVQNTNWVLQGTTAQNYIFKYIGSTPLNNSTSAIGFNLVYKANGSSGSENISITIFDGSGGETNAANNRDVESVNFNSGL